MEEVIISTAQRSLVAGTPLLLGTIGEVICERSGILNLGVEGMMAIGAVTAFIVTYVSGNPWLGLLAAIAAGMLVSSAHAFAAITLQANQVVSGLALTMLGLGLSGLLGKPYIGRPLTVKFESVAVPVLSDIPYLGRVFFDQIKIKSTGESPQATEAQGVNVSAIRYWCVVTGGGLAGMAGANLSISYSKSWIEGMTAGRGWIVIALTIFALWNPMRAVIGAFLFGGIFVLQYLLQPLGISPNLLAALPYAATLVVLLMIGLGDSRKLNAPAMLAEPYKRGER
ncbi:MAG: ABC transporter permease [Deltaproteobacteria bacterium]